MNPAWSVVIFTTLAGAAQGLVVTLAVAALAGLSLDAGFLRPALAAADALLVAGLAASFAHLGRPARAWRAARMWRTSWLSREVIVLPALVAVVALWWLALRQGGAAPGALVLLAGALAAALWVCTAMIYACLRFIEEWAHGLTLANFALTGLASGLVLASTLASATGEDALLAVAGPAALLATGVALGCRVATLRRNATLRPRSTLQSATGIAAPRLAQASMGMTAGSFNTREFFHGRSTATLRRVCIGFLAFGYVLPLAAIAAALATRAFPAWALALLMQAPGLLAERWYFFADARHPQNLYYQTVA